MSDDRLFYRLRGPEWKTVGLPGPTKSYELHKLGKLNLVKDAAGRVGVTADEVRRYFSHVEPAGTGRRRAA